MTKNKRHEKIYLPDQIKLMVSMGEILFDEITETFNIQRGIDNKIRTGMYVILSEPRITDNLVETPIYLPVDNDKALISPQDKPSRVIYSDDIKQEAVCVMINFCGQIIQASVVGLKAHENLAVAIVLLSRITRLSIQQVMRQITANGCKIPRAFHKKDYYLYQICFT